VEIGVKSLFVIAVGLLMSLSARGSPSSQEDLVLSWNNAALQGIRDSKLGAPLVSRALSIIHTCMYEAWVAYDEHAVGTELGGTLRRPASERTSANKQQAISYAAYRALVDVMPGDTNSVYVPLMKQLGYDPNDDSTDIETPTGIGNVACTAVLEFRHHDKSNQLGELAQGPYSDWTGYQSVNRPTPVPARTPMTDPSRWQPLTYVSSTGDLVTHRFVGVQRCYITPFALSAGDEYRWLVQLVGPAKYGSKEFQDQAEGLIQISAGLTDRQKVIAEYWSDGPNSEQPPGHWALFAQSVSRSDHHSLDDDVKMFFALSNAMFDAGIAAWDAKLTYDSVRPATAVPLVFRGKKIRSWGGPGKGTVEMAGSQWIPYQLASFPTPPFPDYVSGHSTYSAAAAEILSLWTASDRFGYSLTVPAGSSQIEPKLTPARPIVLKWGTFSEAANEAGMSRRYGGIHFRGADLAGRLLGRLVAIKAWDKAQNYFDGTAKPVTHEPLMSESLRTP
jgi:hypothetical protein